MTNSQDLVQAWTERFEMSMKRIRQYREDSDPSMRRLTNWMMDTGINPYSFLMPRYASAYDSADAFAGLLHTIHHALVDDGPICFVLVNGRPRIVFAEIDELDKVEIRTTVEIDIDRRRGVGLVVEIIDGVESFILRCNLYHEYEGKRRDLMSELREGRFNGSMDALDALQRKYQAAIEALPPTKQVLPAA